MIINAIGPTLTETPMKRMAGPEDCVGPAIFLCSDASGFVTGNILYPDGGLTAIG
jgi:gluconate 5-dehydrogenase